MKCVVKSVHLEIISFLYPVYNAPQNSPLNKSHLFIALIVFYLTDFTLRFIIYAINTSSPDFSQFQRTTLSRLEALKSSISYFLSLVPSSFFLPWCRLIALFIRSLSMAPSHKLWRNSERAIIFGVAVGGGSVSAVIWGVIYRRALLPPLQSFSGKTKTGERAT